MNSFLGALVSIALLLFTALFSQSTMENPFVREIGPELYAACAQNDVTAVRNLTTPTTPSGWSDVLAIAAAEGALEVSKHCIQQGARVDDNVLRKVICNDRSETLYRYFVESDLVGVDYYIERWGTMLGISAAAGRKSLVEYLLRKGGDPNCRIDAHLFKTALACAAGFSDEDVLGLLLDHGARLNSSGALAFAAQKNRAANVKFLLARGADVDEMGIENPCDRRSLKNLGVSPVRTRICQVASQLC